MTKKLYMIAVALLVCATTYAQDVVLWGNNKDSQFDGGLNGWKTNAISCVNKDSLKYAVWDWSKDGKASGGAFFGTQGAIVSTSVANGAAVFNSDKLDNNGNSALIGKGKCIAPHVSELVSPAFAIPATETDLTLTFSQAYRNFQANCFVSWSEDDGKTWSAQINVNADVAANQVAPITNKAVRLVGAKPSAKFRVKFTFDGNYYYWTLDDVAVIRSRSFDLFASNSWFAINHNRVTPKGLVEPFPVMVNVVNKGSKKATNAKVNVKVIDEIATTVVYDETYKLGTGTIAPGDTNLNLIHTKLVTLKDVGTYAGTYTVSADSVDQDKANNVLTFRTSVSDTTFSREINRTRTLLPAASNWTTGAPHSWAIGNCFYVPKNDGDFIATSAQFGLNFAATSTTAAQFKDKVVNVYLYKWKDADADGNAQETERELVGFADGGYVGKGNEVNSVAGTDMNKNLNIKVSLVDFNEPAKKLKLVGDTYYILALEYVAPDDKVNMIVEVSATNNYNPSFYAMQQLGKDRVGYQLGIGDSKDWQYDAFNPANLSSYLAPCIRLNVKNTKIIGTNDVKLADNAVKIAPNPANTQFGISFNFATEANDVRIKLFDATGRIVREEMMQNVTNEGIMINTADLTPGVYNLSVTSDQGNTVKQVVIVR